MKGLVPGDPTGIMRSLPGGRSPRCHRQPTCCPAGMRAPSELGAPVLLVKVGDGRSSRQHYDLSHKLGPILIETAIATNAYASGASSKKGGP